MKQPYITIQMWMSKELGLSGNELLTYALIYGFCQDGKSRFRGSRSYIAKWCNCTVRAAQNILDRLIEKNLIIKYTPAMYGKNSCEYAINFETGEESSHTGEESSHTGEESSLYNIDNTHIDNNRSSTNYFVISPDEPVGSCNSETQQTEDYNDAMLEPNKNKIDADDVGSHGYSKEELKEEFLQSRRKKSTKCKSLFHKCLDEIDSYTDDSKLRQTLIDYLTMRLAVKDKPLRGVNQWKGMLNKLDTISGDKLQIVRHCIERGWLSFFPISNGFRNDPSKFGETESVRSEEVPDNWREIERAKAEKLGRRTSF